jgi:hypothetical protein
LRGKSLAKCLPGKPPLLTLYYNMRKLKLDVETHVPVHGRVGTNEEFLKIVGKPAVSLAQN